MTQSADQLIEQLKTKLSGPSSFLSNLKEHLPAVTAPGLKTGIYSTKTIAILAATLACMFLLRGQTSAIADLLLKAAALYAVVRLVENGFDIARDAVVKKVTIRAFADIEIEKINKGIASSGIADELATLDKKPA